MSTVQTRAIIHCDEPGCPKMIEVELYPVYRTVSESLRIAGWQPWGADDYCPEHKKDE